MRELGEVEEALQRLYKQEEEFWRQRAKLLWIKECDLNTKAFHSTAKGRQRKNQIRSLQNEARDWLYLGNGLEEHVEDYFLTLFRSSSVDPSMVVEAIGPRITEQHNVFPLSPFTRSMLRMRFSL